MLASTWKNSVNATIGVAGMLLNPHTIKSLNSIEKVQPRIMVATFNGNPGPTIISCDSPTNTIDETDLDTFYNELSSFIYILRAIVLIFVALFITTFRPLYAPAFFSWLECRTLFRLPVLTVLVPRAIFNGCQLRPPHSGEHD